MSEDNRDDLALTAELASLRAALREVHAPDGAQALLAAYRARLTARVPAAAAARRPRRAFALVAAALLVAVTALVALRADRAERGAGPAATRAAAAAPRAPPPASSAFRPLGFARRVSAAESYSVVRVRIHVPALAPGVSGPAAAAIEADLLVGEDGLARAIRFDEADTLFVSNAADRNGEPR